MYVRAVIIVLFTEPFAIEFFCAIAFRYICAKSTAPMLRPHMQYVRQTGMAQLDAARNSCSSWREYVSRNSSSKLYNNDVACGHPVVCDGQDVL